MYIQLSFPDRGLLDYKKKVVDYWPEFAAHGKEQITIEQLFSHQVSILIIYNT